MAKSSKKPAAKKTAKKPAAKKAAKSAKKPAAKKASKKPAAKKAKAAKPAKKKRGGGGPKNMKEVTPDAVLAAVVGGQSMKPTEVVSRIWKYIHKHDLQDKKVRTAINADEALKKLFGGKSQVTMFELNKFAWKHLH